MGCTPTIITYIAQRLKRYFFKNKDLHSCDSLEINNHSLSTLTIAIDAPAYNTRSTSLLNILTPILLNRNFPINIYDL